MIAAIQGDPHLESRTIEFLKHVLRNRQCDETTRNNAANALLYQERIDIEVPSLLLAMFVDSTESIQWRDYLVQHLAVSVATSPRPEEALSVLREVASRTHDGIGATALLHLHRLDQQGLNCFPETLLGSARQWAVNPSMDQRVRMSCLAIISERRDLLARSQVRSLLKDADPVIARQAIATLGMIGELTDEEALLNACASDNEVVAGIARAALDRLRSTPASVPATDARTPAATF